MPNSRQRLFFENPKKVPPQLVRIKEGSSPFLVMTLDWLSCFSNCQQARHPSCGSPFQVQICPFTQNAHTNTNLTHLHFSSSNQQIMEVFNEFSCNNREISNHLYRVLMEGADCPQFLSILLLRILRLFAFYNQFFKHLTCTIQTNSNHRIISVRQEIGMSSSKRYYLLKIISELSYQPHTIEHTSYLNKYNLFR